MARSAPSTNCDSGGAPIGEDARRPCDASLRRGMRILAWLLVFSLLVALAGSLAFESGRFDAFPSSWF